MANNKKTRYSSYGPSKTVEFESPKIWSLEKWMQPCFKGMYKFSDSEYFEIGGVSSLSIDVFHKQYF